MLVLALVMLPSREQQTTVKRRLSEALALCGDWDTPRTSLCSRCCRRHHRRGSGLPSARGCHMCDATVACACQSHRVLAYACSCERGDSYVLEGAGELTGSHRPRAVVTVAHLHGWRRSEHVVTAGQPQRRHRKKPSSIACADGRIIQYQHHAFNYAGTHNTANNSNNIGVVSVYDMREAHTHR
jgi:hypothetical protein